MSCPSCLVRVVLSKMSCPGCSLSTGTVVPSWLPYLSWMSCTRYLLSIAVVVPSRLSCLSCSVLAAIFWPFCLCSYPDCTIPSVFLTFLSQFSCPHFPVLAVLTGLSWPGCLVLAVLSKLSYTSCPAWLFCPSYPIPTVLSLLPSPSCPFLAAQPRHPLSSDLWCHCHALAVLSSVLSRLTNPGWPLRLTYEASLSRQTCPGCPVWVVLSQKSFDNWTITLVLFPCPVLAVLLWQYCYLFPVLDVMSWLSYLAVLSRLSCPGYHVRLSYPCWPVPAILSQQSCPGLSWCRCPCIALMSWLVLSVLPRLTCPSCRVFYPGCSILSVFLTFLSQFSCPGFPVLAVLSRMYCPGCPVQAVLYQLSFPCAFSQLSFPSFSARTPLSTSLMMPMPCSGSSVLLVPSRLTYPG